MVSYFLLENERDTEKEKLLNSFTACAFAVAVLFSALRAESKRG